MSQRIHGRAALGSQGDYVAVAVAVAVEQAREVLADRGLGQPEVMGQVNDPVLAEGEMLHDREPRTVAEPVEEARSRRERFNLTHPRSGVACGGTSIKTLPALLWYKAAVEIA